MLAYKSVFHIRLLHIDETFTCRQKKLMLCPAMCKSLHHTYIIDECLNAHNVLRALHPGTGAMTWNDDVAKGAQEWANYLATLGKMEHASGTGLGENLYTSWWGLSGCGSATCSAAVRAW